VRQQLLVLGQHSGRLEVPARGDQADQCPVGRHDRDRVHGDLGPVAVQADSVGDHQPGLPDRLELGAAVLGEQILDRQVVQLQRLCDVA